MTRHHDDPTGTHRSRRLLWLGGSAAAVILVLGVNGTLASWSEAILHNDPNTTKAAGSVALEERWVDDTSQTVVCSTAADADNEVTCSTINKYGGVDHPLEPGDDVTTTVALKNVGTATGDLTLEAGECTKSGGPDGSVGDICDQVDVTLACASTPKYDGTLNALADEADADGPLAISTALAADNSVSCAFIVALKEDAPANVAGMTAIQVLTWRLKAA